MYTVLTNESAGGIDAKRKAREDKEKYQSEKFNAIKKREWFRKEAERIQKEKADAAKAAAAANRKKVEQYTGRPMSDYRSSRPASERQFTGHGKSGMGRSADRFA